ncbi:MAG: metalloregulator ArsR/SmtB family transcription factor [Deltaproteobacteria bacterium]|nr:metalloregulator ArsR/SmtB family transcription factor [Deltaproteobacteria bacterium]
MQLRQAVNLTKALGEENRLRLILALEGRELCVCQLTLLLGLAPSTVSKHVSVLRQAGLVESWKEGRWVYCRLATPADSAEVAELLAWARKWLAGSRQASRDAERLADILMQDKEEICRRQQADRKSPPPAPLRTR